MRSASADSLRRLELPDVHSSVVVGKAAVAAYLPGQQGRAGRMERFVADGEVRTALSREGHVERVIVLAQRAEQGRTDFIPYLVVTWRRGYVAIGKWNGQGARAWRDLTRLVSFLREDFRYHGPITVYEADDPQLRKLSTIFAPSDDPAAGQGDSIPMPTGPNVDDDAAGNPELRKPFTIFMRPVHPARGDDGNTSAPGPSASGDDDPADTSPPDRTE